VKTADLCREHGISAATFMAGSRSSVLNVEGSSYRYEPRPDRNNAELREELLKLARQKPRYGHFGCSSGRPLSATFPPDHGSRLLSASSLKDPTNVQLVRDDALDGSTIMGVRHCRCD
jgi:hypothetical protein